MRTSRLIFKLLIVPLLAAPAAVLAEPVYSLTLLPADFHASAINSSGQVAGTGGGGAAIWSDSGLVSLAAVAPGSEGLALNDNGALVGRHGLHAFSYAGGTLTDLGSGGFRSWATGINNAGTVVGTERDTAGAVSTRGFIHTGGAISYIEPFGEPFSYATAINQSGQVTGYATTAADDAYSDPARNAFLYSGGSLRSLGSLGGRVSEGNDLNDAGLVVGWSETATLAEERPFLFSPVSGMLTDLGSLGGSSGRANGINNLGMVVGMSDIGAAAGYDYRAFLYADGGMVDLNTLVDGAGGWRLVSAQDINDARQILGQACHEMSGECRAVRLDLISPIPEPATWSMLLAGAALLGGIGQRRAPGRIGRVLRRWRRLWLLALLGSPLAALAQPTFSLNFLPSGFSAAGINNTGQVVGTFGGAAAVWSDSGISDLNAVAPGSFGMAINNHGHIAGSWNSDAFVHTPGALRQVGRGLWQSSWAMAINDSGQVGGNAGFAVGERVRGFVYSDGVIRMVPTFGGDFSQVFGMNNAGLAVGSAATADDGPGFNDSRHAFTYIDRVMTDLGTLGGLKSEAHDINDAGQIVGGSTLVPELEWDDFVPFLFEDGAMRSLGTLGGSYAMATGINNAGMVVGSSTLGGDALGTHGFLYDSDRLLDLNALISGADGWVLVSADDINDAHQILGQACRMDECLPVRLDLVPAIPEPATLGMLVAGLAVIGIRRRYTLPDEPG